MTRARPGQRDDGGLLRAPQRGGRLALALALLAPIAACQQVTFGSGSGDDSDWVGTSSGPWGDDDDDDDGSEPTEGSDEGPPKLDMPPELPIPDCKAVDLLFVVDNSNSMLTEQDNLATSFEGFIEGIKAKLVETNDYHVGVVTTDAYASNEAGCQSIGALVTQTDTATCGPWAQGRYISLDDDLDSAFSCAAKVGIEGSGDEHQLEAALAAIGPALAGEGGCNEGFIREDALLVLVLITDEDDGAVQTPLHTGSPGEPQDWIDAVVEFKGLESNVVVLALAGVLPPNDCQPNVPYEGSQLAKRIGAFVEGFTYAEIGDVCSDDYSPFFDASLDVITEACAGFSEVE